MSSPIYARRINFIRPVEVCHLQYTGTEYSKKKVYGVFFHRPGPKTRACRKKTEKAHFYIFTQPFLIH